MLDWEARVNRLAGVLGPAARTGVLTRRRRLLRTRQTGRKVSGLVGAARLGWSWGGLLAGRAPRVGSGASFKRLEGLAGFPAWPGLLSALIGP